jgi:Xaa-Pro dipeptidase
MNENRIQRVLNKMQTAGLSQLIVSDPLSIGYLTGEYIHPGERMLALLLKTDGAHRFFVNALFPAPDCGIPVVRFSDTDDGPAFVAAELDASAPVGIDKTWPARFLIRLMELQAAAGYVNGSGCVDWVRAVKDEEEQQKMRISSAVNDACMAEFVKALHIGATEKELEQKYIEIYAAHGCSGVSFTPIVGFGKNAADPHHENDGSTLEKGMCVLLDVGGVYDGYCSDMTRTFLTAAPSEEEARVYELVRAANEAAEKLIRPGVRLCDIDAAARDIITKGGYGPQFTHRLGHFIGLEDHEYGDVSANFDTPVEEGMCFSIEPGVYLEGKFGVRIEDLIIVTRDGCEVLNRYPKDLTVLDL